MIQNRYRYHKGIDKKIVGVSNTKTSEPPVCTLAEVKADEQSSVYRITPHRQG